jgi:lipopolysaccharide export system protein LptC
VNGNGERSGSLSNRIWLLAALVLCIVGAGLLIRDRDPTRGTGALLFPEVGEGPDVYLEQAALRQYAANGALQYRLRSDEVRFFEFEGVTRLRAPELLLFEGGGHPWRIRAELGTIQRADPEDESGDVVLLRNDVVLDQPQRPDPLRLTTSELTLFPDRQYAETDQAVIIDGRIGRTMAAGLKGDLEGGILQLESAPGRPVQTILLPDQFK